MVSKVVFHIEIDYELAVEYMALRIGVGESFDWYSGGRGTYDYTWQYKPQAGPGMDQL
jgi:hypothetical protein